MTAAPPPVLPPPLPAERKRLADAEARTLLQGDEPRRGPVRRSVRDLAWALLLTGLAHLAVLWFAPETLFLPAASGDEVADGSARRDLEFVFEPPPEEVPPEQQRYVNTNPDKPSNPPPEPTPNISDRDQQAAQEDLVGEIDPENRPRNDGELEDSMQVVEGSLDQPPPLPVAPPPGVRDPAEAQAAAEVLPTAPPPPRSAAPDFLEAAPETAEGVASALEIGEGDRETIRPGEAPIPLTAETPEAADGETEPRPQQSPTAALAVVGPEGDPNSREPRPRPRVAPEVIQSPTLRNATRADQAGIVGIDAMHTEMGEYMREVLGIVSLHWNNLARQTYRSAGTDRSQVLVEFTIESDGTVSDARVVETTAGRAATLITIDGVTGRAPYRPWSEAMIRTLGDRQTVRIRFLYW